MDDERLVKQAFLQSAVLGPVTHSNSVHKSWAGQVVSFLATLGMRVERDQRLCQRCDANSIDDVERMIFDCVAMDVEQQKHQSLFARGRVALIDISIQDPTEFAARLLQGLQRVISYSVLSIYEFLVRRPVVGYLNRPEMASNR